jgi:hypothetical protein
MHLVCINSVTFNKFPLPERFNLSFFLRGGSVMFVISPQKMFHAVFVGVSNRYYSEKCAQIYIVTILF